MEKKIKIFAILLPFLLVLGSFLAFLFLRQAVDRSKSPILPLRTTPVPTFYQRPTFGPVMTFTPTIQLPSAQEDKINISDVWINNFYKTPQRINSTGDVLIVDNTEFQIVYLPLFNKFMISIVSSPFEEVKKVAEEEFLKVLGVNREEACRLMVFVDTPYFANPNYSGKDYPLSFCEEK